MQKSQGCESLALFLYIGIPPQEEAVQRLFIVGDVFFVEDVYKRQI